MPTDLTPIDDQERNLQCARALGMRALNVTTDLRSVLEIDRALVREDPPSAERALSATGAEK